MIGFPNQNLCFQNYFGNLGNLDFGTPFAKSVHQFFEILYICNQEDMAYNHLNFF